MTWVIANGYKMRRLRNQGYGRRTAEKMSHGHFHKKKYCVKVKENILANKKTTKRDLWTLGCYVRVCDKTYRHYSWVCGIYETKKQKGKQETYYNVGAGKL